MTRSGLRTTVVPALAVGWAMLAAACEQPSVVAVGSPPELQALDVVATIEGVDYFPSDLAAVGACKLWLVGGDWGLIVELDLASGESRPIGRLPVEARNARFEPAPDGRLLVWSQASGTVGWIDTRTTDFRRIALPPHPWMGSAIGPSVVLPRGEIAVVPIGDRPILESPRPWQHAPLISLLDTNGRVIGSLGRIPDRGGSYLSAAWSQVRIGSRGDTLLVARLSDATLHRFTASGGDGVRDDSSVVRLPRYFEAPPAWEDVWRAPWLLNGAHPRVYHVPQLGEAVFAPDGRLFVVRNGGAEWSDADGPMARAMYERVGRWQVTREWLEAYTPTGDFVGAYALPKLATARLAMDGMGRLVVWDSNGRALLIRDPSVERADPCARISPAIRIPHVDAPDGALVGSAPGPVAMMDSR